MKTRPPFLPTLALILTAGVVFPLASATVQVATVADRSPIPQPYVYVPTGGFTGPAVPESPDPLVAYRWPAPKASDALEVFVLKPKAVSADPSGSFLNVSSLIGPSPNVTVRGTGALRLDFGLEMAAWIEFDSPDCPGGIDMSISEYDEPGVNKTKAPVRHGDTYRLELNRAGRTGYPL